MEHYPQYALADVLRLTRWQIHNVLFVPLTDPEQAKGFRSFSYQTQFWDAWKRRGLSEDQIRQKWAEYQRERNGK